MLVVGPNGAGKTNLLEALHVGTQGFSPRTRTDAQLVRFGERRGADRAARRPRRRRRSRSTSCSRPGEGKRAELNGVAAARGRAAARRARDARVHARPARRRQGRPGGAARVLRPRRSAGSSRPARRCRPSTARRSRSGTRRCGAWPPASRRATRSRRGRQRWRSSGPRSSRPAARRSPRSSRASPSGADELGLPDGALATSRRAADGGGARGAARRATSSAASPGSGPHLDDVTIARGDRDLRSSARRASSGSPSSRSCSARPTCSRDRGPRRRCCSSTTSSRSSTRRRREILAARISSVRPGARHGDEPRRAPARARPAARGRAGRTAARDARDGAGSATRSSASSAASGPQGASAASSRRGRRRSGATIARNAWPARIARDGTLHVTTTRLASGRSSWASARREIGERLGGSAPPAIRFAPGRLPEPDARSRRPNRLQPRVEPRPERAQAAGDRRLG